MTFPSRPIISMAPCGGECGTSRCLAIVVTCDCATVTHLEFAGDLTEPGKAAVTCDGCASVTWFEVRPA